jgi:hypothetical protein
MNGHRDTARALYLELRALGLKLRVEDDPDGGPLDYRIALNGLCSLSEARACQVVRNVRRNEEGLVLVLLDRRDPDLDAVRREGHC